MVAILVQTNLDWLIFIIKIFIAFITKPSYLNEEVICTEPSPLLVFSGYKNFKMH
jgi:hypothetical protein